MAKASRKTTVRQLPKTEAAREPDDTAGDVAPPDDTEHQDGDAEPPIADAEIVRKPSTTPKVLLGRALGDRRRRDAPLPTPAELEAWLSPEELARTRAWAAEQRARG